MTYQWLWYAFLYGVAMFGLLVYILISLLIYYVTVDWPWIVFSAVTFFTFFAGYATLSRRHYAHIA